MRLSRFLPIVAMVTIVALGYVHQQVELLKINYTINQNRDNLLVLLDQNSTLMYNVGCLQSPLYLERTLSTKDVSWEVPSYLHAIGLAEAAR